MQALALDFDGVISDSARESFSTALGAYLKLRPASGLVDRDRAVLYAAFVEAMPLGNRAEDYGAILAALEDGASLADQASYDAVRAAQDPPWMERYHALFYRVRRASAAADPVAWRGLMRPYAPFLELLRRRRGSVPYAIATAKDGASVDALLEDYGVTDLFPRPLRLDKETGASKISHLRRLGELLDLELAALTFVDDKVNHLDAVAPLGVRCALATWGYNGERERRLARRRGYLLCSLDDAERQLFGS